MRPATGRPVLSYIACVSESVFVREKYTYEGVASFAMAYKGIFA